MIQRSPKPEIMPGDLIQQLKAQDIHPFGSAELLKFEQHMTRYFEREYERWRGNDNPPEHYGVSSFQGDIASKDTCRQSIDHYDQDLEIYRKFLDPDYMCYTMGFFGATNQSPAIDPDISLSDAQTRKFDLIIERADIADRQHILELGCGFGGFSKYLLNRFPEIELTVVNPCEVQAGYIKGTLMADESIPGSRIKLIAEFFDDLSPHDLGTGRFDRVISIGVLEAVTNLDKLFNLIARVLKPGGKTLHHFIVSADTIPNFLNAENTRMQNYFPGGHIWPYSEARRHNNHLDFVDSWFMNGLNYWKTLDEWHQRFWAAITDLYPATLDISAVKEWNDYFVLCKTMFNPNEGKSYGVGHFLYQKKLTD